VTITGPGGVGKTRLALELGRALGDRFAGEAWMVDLATGSAETDVAAEVGRVLGVQANPRSGRTDALARYIADRELLLVLDNCEHLVAACAELVAALLGASPGLRVVATSREVLGVPGETVWRLEPLEAEDARRLFAERSRRRRPDFAPDPETDDVIGRLCERLDRLPLAIELAAARVGVLSPAEILTALESGGDALGSSSRTAGEHQRTLRHVVDWSYGLLDPGEQEAFLGLSVFAGSFGAEAAAAIAPGASLDALAGLVEKSLVAVIRREDRETRYRLLDTIRDRALELLVLDGREREARRRHLEFFAGLGAQARDDWLLTGKQSFVNRLDDDFENIRAAAAWAIEADPCAAMVLVGGTRDLFFRFGQADGMRLATALLERCDSADANRVHVLLAAGQTAITLREFDQAQSFLAEAHVLAGQLDEPVLAAWTRFFQGLAGMLSGERAGGRELLEEARALHHDLGVPVGEARATSALGGTYLMGGEHDRARELIQRALELCEEQDEEWGQGQAHTFLGLIAADSDRSPASAAAHHRRAIELLAPSRDATLLPVAIVGRAALMAQRDPELALRLIGGALGIRRRVGGELAPYYQQRFDSARAAAAAAAGDGSDRLIAQGERMSLEETVALALGRQRSVAAERRPGGLSARELEVVELLAEGLQNKEIAARLHLSVRTVESHVRHALGKAGLENRTQLAAWARERIQ
jgi:predicted ATPase/DNA-binding CsgD family transcriptional regulator